MTDVSYNPSTNSTSTTKIFAGCGISTLTCANRLTLNNEKIHFGVIMNRKGGGGGVLSTGGDWSIGITLNLNLHTKYTLGSIDEIAHSSSPLSLHNNILLMDTERQHNMCSKAGGSSSITKTNYVTISGQRNVKGMTPRSFAAPDGK
jgi:hypothetical protein